MKLTNAGSHHGKYTKNAAIVSHNLKYSFLIFKFMYYSYMPHQKESEPDKIAIGMPPVGI